MRAAALPPLTVDTRTNLLGGTKMRYRSRGSSLWSSVPATRVDGRVDDVSGGSPSEKSTPGLTWRMSSFGSLGSFGGVGAASAAGMLTSPQPLAVSNPGGPMSRAVDRSSCITCAADSVGRTVQIHAAAAVTTGAEKLVP